jgi:hypothetical protein
MRLVQYASSQMRRYSTDRSAQAHLSVQYAVVKCGYPASVLIHCGEAYPCGAIDRRAFHFVAGDEANDLPRFYGHWMTPLYLPVTALRHIHWTSMPYPRGHGLAVPAMPDARRYARQGAKDIPNARHARAVLASAGETWPAQ